MDHDREHVESLIERYLAREMSDEEERAWEEHYFACDDCFMALREATLIGRFLREEVAKPAREARAAGGWLRRLFPAAAPAPRFALALAALVVATAPAIFGWMAVRRLRGELDALRQPSVPVGSFVLQEGTRGPGAPVVELPEQGGSFLLHFSLLAAPSDSVTYRGAIVADGGRVVWRGEDLRGDGPYGTFTIVCQGAAFAPGGYELRVEEVGRRGERVLERFSFAFRVAVRRGDGS